MAPEREIPEHWVTTTGFRDDFDFCIDHSYFGYDAQYQDGKQLLLIWEGHVIDPESEENNNAAHHEQWSVGGKDKEGNYLWTTEDNGRSMVHAKDLKVPNKSSFYGRIIDWAMTQESDELVGILAKGDPKESGIWNGVVLHMKTREFDYGGEIGKKPRVFPEHFIGFDTESATPTTTDIPKARGTGTASTPQSASAPAGGSVSEKLLGRLAKASDSFEEFVEAAIDIPDVKSNTELRASVMDDGPTGFYATARG
jgi:hypothetical protein